MAETIAFQKRTGAIALTDPSRDSFGVEIVRAPQPPATIQLLGWAPDSRQLLLLRDRRLVVLDVITGAERQLVEALGGVWSPDGKEIAFAAASPQPDPFLPARLELDLIHPDGAGRRTLVGALPTLSAIAWSPDSSRLAFIAGAIGIVSRDGSDGPRYSETGYGPLEWRTTGIFFNGTVPFPPRPLPLRLDPDGGGVVRLTHLPNLYQSSFLTASQDGRSVAYSVTRDSDPEPFGLRIAEASGTRDGPLLACLGTSRPDHIHGSALADVIRAGSADDVVHVRGGGSDRIDCGRGRDIVYADRRDTAERNCERVVR